MKAIGFSAGASSSDDHAGWIDDRSGFSIAIHVCRPEFVDRAHNRYAAGLHHLAFNARSRGDVDKLHELLQEIGARVLDAPGEYYANGYYALFFADPDEIKLEYVFLPARRGDDAPQNGVETYPTGE